MISPGRGKRRGDRCRKKVQTGDRSREKGVLTLTEAVH